MSGFPPFAKRQNWNSSIDSICTKCFQTIAPANIEMELAAREQKHTCDPFGAFSHTYAGSVMGTHSAGHRMTKLKRVNFPRRSCESYDQGHWMGSEAPLCLIVSRVFSIAQTTANRHYYSSTHIRKQLDATKAAFVVGSWRERVL